jgi:hypothetical protein
MVGLVPQPGGFEGFSDGRLLGLLALFSWLAGRFSRSVSTPLPMTHERDQPHDTREQGRHPRPRADIDVSKDDRGDEAQRRAYDYKAPPPALLRRPLWVGAHRPHSIPLRGNGGSGGMSTALPDRRVGRCKEQQRENDPK